MPILTDVHQQFAAYFPSPRLQPYLYLLSKKLSEGHICIDLATVHSEEWLAAGYTDWVTAQELQKELLVTAGDTLSPFVLFNNRLYLQRYFNYETIILNRINSFINTAEEQTAQRILAVEAQVPFIKQLFTPVNTGVPIGDNTNWPLVAGITAVINNFTIITGGPGTGKTTTVAKILAILYTLYPNLTVALAAPTGKAAARMAESLKSAALQVNESIQAKFTKLEPATIHRLLGPIKNKPLFKHHSQRQLDYDVVIADESSMIDVALFAKLMDAIGPNTRLILLGDKDQLASVEAGSLFGDLCQAQPYLNKLTPSRAALINLFIDGEKDKINADHIVETINHPLFQHIIELQRSHRFLDSEGIGKFSKAIINNREADIQYFFSNKDEQVFIDTSYSSSVFEQFVNGYLHFIKEKNISLALKKLNQLRVLCAVKAGEQGLYATNKKIEKYLQQQGAIQLTGDFYENRPVMVTNNNYELQLFNGDIGIIRPDEMGTLKAWFEADNGEVRSVLPGYIAHAETVYAMTIHKSQGSEFNQVMVCLPKGDNFPILTRELLYTAVTRAKQKVLVLGSEALILATAAASVQRGSGINDRFI